MRKNKNKIAIVGSTGLNDIEEAASNSGGAGSNASTSNADFDFDSVLEKLAASLDDNQF